MDSNFVFCINSTRFILTLHTLSIQYQAMGTRQECTDIRHKTLWLKKKRIHIERYTCSPEIKSYGLFKRNKISLITQVIKSIWYKILEFWTAQGKFYAVGDFNQHVEGRVDGRAEGRTDGRTEGQTDKRMVWLYQVHA